MKRIFIILFLIAARAIAPAIQSLSDQTLLQIQFDQKPGAQISSDLAFRDETGKSIHLGDYFGRRPTILIAGYYGCPMLCTLVLNGATESFRGLKGNVGQQFDVIFVSIDPKETPQLAAEKKGNYLRDYGRPGSAAGWHFLTGDQPAIHRLADEIGFRFAYDPATKQFAHPSGFVVLTPGGKVSRYFFGVTFSPAELAAALRGAATENVSPAASALSLLCFQHSPLAGKYGKAVMATVRITAGATVLMLGIFLVTTSRQKRGKAE
jgi:protein SCO1